MMLQGTFGRVSAAALTTGMRDVRSERKGKLR